MYLLSIHLTSSTHLTRMYHNLTTLQLAISHLISITSLHQLISPNIFKWQYLTSAHLTYPNITSPIETSPHLISTHFIPLYLILISTHLISPHLPLLYLLLASSHLNSPQKFIHHTSTHLTSIHHQLTSLHQFISPNKTSLFSTHNILPHLTLLYLILASFHLSSPQMLISSLPHLNSQYFITSSHLT